MICRMSRNAETIQIIAAWYNIQSYSSTSWKREYVCSLVFTAIVTYWKVP